MKNTSQLLLLASLTLLVSCQREKSGVFYLDSAPVFQAKPANPLAPDSINSFRPVLGDANVVRRFPFGASDKPSSSLRLTEVNRISGSGPLKTVYHYDDSSRLSAITDYIEPDVRLEKRTYQRDGSSALPNISTEINRIKVYGYLGPLKDELVLSTSTKYEPTDETKSWILKSEEANPSVFSLKPGTTRIRQGFGMTGALVWEEEIYLNAADATITAYKLFRRDVEGNAVFVRSVDKYQVSEETISYDDKPNPYYLTGDIVSLEATNRNNILTRRAIENGRATTRRYEYEYRPDGYPSRVKSYRNGELDSTMEFVYNQ